MKTVKFVPTNGMLDCFMPDVGMAFKAGQERTVTDVQFDLLMKNPHFVDASTHTSPPTPASTVTPGDKPHA